MVHLISLPHDLLVAVLSQLPACSLRSSVPHVCRALLRLAHTPELAAAWLLSQQPHLALMLAATSGRPDVLRIVLHRLTRPGYCAPPDTQQLDAALCKAAALGHASIARQLLEHGAPAAGLDRSGAPLLAAAAAGQTQVMAMLLKQSSASEQGFGGQSHRQDSFITTRQTCPGSNAPRDVRSPPESSPAGAVADVYCGLSAALVAAAGAGQLAAVQLLLQYGARAESAALSQAAAHGFVAVMRALLAAGCPAAGQECEALCRAACRGQLEAVRVLWGAGGAGQAAARAPAALVLAAREGQRCVVSFLLAQSVDGHANEEEALRLAAAHGHLGVVQLLLGHGALVNAVEGQALRLACEAQHVATAQLLLAHGADVSVRGQAPLKAAARTGNVQLLRLLIAAGADVHVSDDAPLRTAASMGAFAAVRELLAAGADVRGSDGEALLWAADNGHEEVVGLLLSAGALAEGSTGEQLLWCAIAKGHQGVVRRLMDAGARLTGGV
ncbi:ankyrin repeat-containing domain protein [Haematococcus lacustris]